MTEELASQHLEAALKLLETKITIGFVELSMVNICVSPVKVVKIETTAK